jgi:hypothetical protein
MVENKRTIVTFIGIFGCSESMIQTTLGCRASVDGDLATYTDIMFA